MYIYILYVCRYIYTHFSILYPKAPFSYCRGPYLTLSRQILQFFCIDLTPAEEEQYRMAGFDGAQGEVSGIRDWALEYHIL